MSIISVNLTFRFFCLNRRKCFFKVVINGYIVKYCVFCARTSSGIAYNIIVGICLYFKHCRPSNAVSTVTDLLGSTYRLTSAVQHLQISRRSAGTAPSVNYNSRRLLYVYVKIFFSNIPITIKFYTVFRLGNLCTFISKLFTCACFKKQILAGIYAHSSF